MTSSNDRAEGWTNYSDHFKGVPQKRSCTDIYCLAVLVVFVFCWFAVGYYAYHNGDITRLMAPKDSMGRTCGVDEDVADAKYLFFFDISQCVSLSVFIFGCPTKQVCVKECPRERWRVIDVYRSPPGTHMWRTKVQEKLLCNDSKIAASVTTEDALKKVISEDTCAAAYDPSTSAFFNLCLPVLGITGRGLSADIAENIDTEKAQNYFSYANHVGNLIREDLKKCWHFIVLFVSVSLLASLFVIIVMGIITKVVIWFTLALILIFLLYSSIITFMQYDSMPESGTYATMNGDFYSETAYGQLQWLFQQRQTWLILFIVSISFFSLFLLLVIFLRSRIELAVMLIGEGSKAINRIKSTLCFPLITRLLQLAIILWFFSIFFYVKSLGNTVYTVRGLNETTSDCVCQHYKENDWCLPHKFQEECHSLDGKESCLKAGCLFKEFRHPKMKYYLQLYNLFGLLWGLYFVSGLSRTVLSMSFANWYWTYNKYDLPFFTLIYSFLITIRYHLGTIALGSFLIATCGFIRTLLEHTQRMLKQSDGLVSQCLTWSMRCCFWCLQKFLIFLSNNAYVMCAILGTSFFSSAGEALGLMARNIVRVVVLDKVLDFLMLIGKLSVTLLLGSLSYFAFSRDTLNLHYPMVPTVIVVIVVWIISSSFFGVYEVAVDTLFLSFLKDGEINDGSQNKPYYMSHKLKYMLKENLKSSKRKIRNDD